MAKPPLPAAAEEYDRSCFVHVLRRRSSEACRAMRARRIAANIAKLPELLKRPQYCPRAARSPHQSPRAAMTRIILTIGLLVAAVLFLYWLGAFDLPISIARWWIGGHGRRRRRAPR